MAQEGARPDGGGAPSSAQEGWQLDGGNTPSPAHEGAQLEGRDTPGTAQEGAQLDGGNTLGPAQEGAQLDGGSAPGSEAPFAGSESEAAKPFEERLGASASVRTAIYSKDLSFNGETGFVVGSAWLTLKPDELYGVRSRVEARVQGQNLTRDAEVKLTWDAREAWVERSFGFLDLRAGRQINLWGRADKVNPTDVWTSRDFTLLTTDDEDQRLGAAAVQTTVTLGEFRLIGLWQPEFRVPVLAFPPSPGVSLVELKPTRTLTQLGLKADHSGGRVDYSLSYAHVLNRSPDLSVLSASSSALQLGLLFHEVDVFGADGAFNLGSIGFRGEVGYVRTSNVSGLDPLIQRGSVFAVVGAERTFVGVFNVNVQYMHKYIFNWRDPYATYDANTAPLAFLLNLTSNQVAPNNEGATVHLDVKAFNDTLEAGVALLSWFAKGEGAVRPDVTYAFTDHIKAVAGGLVFFGPQDSFYGKLNPASTAFVELRLGI